MEKTNVMRLLAQNNIPFTAHSYDPTVTEGEKVAALVGAPCERTFKTLVTAAPNKTHFVFVIPVHKTLDLKKAAKAAGVKSIAMIPQKELLPLTGYIHGGCSPIGMKKKFETFYDQSITAYETIFCSAGKVGQQIEIQPQALIEFTNGRLAQIGA